MLQHRLDGILGSPPGAVPTVTIPVLGHVDERKSPSLEQMREIVIGLLLDTLGRRRVGNGRIGQVQVLANLDHISPGRSQDMKKERLQRPIVRIIGVGKTHPGRCRFTPGVEKRAQMALVENDQRPRGPALILGVQRGRILLCHGCVSYQLR